MDGDIGVEQDRSEARPPRQLLVAPAFDGRWCWQGAKTFDHRRYGHCRRVDRHHVSGTDDHEFHVLPERDIPGQSNRLTISASKRPASGNSHFDLRVYVLRVALPHTPLPILRETLDHSNDPSGVLLQRPKALPSRPYDRRDIGSQLIETLQLLVEAQPRALTPTFRLSSDNVIDIRISARVVHRCNLTQNIRPSSLQKKSLPSWHQLMALQNLFQSRQVNGPLL